MNKSQWIYLTLTSSLLITACTSYSPSKEEAQTVPEHYQKPQAKNEIHTHEDVEEFEIPAPVHEGQRSHLITHQSKMKRAEISQDHISQVSSVGAIYKKIEDPAVHINTSQESYRHQEENSFRSAKLTPLSTFSIDVDNASYSNVRRFLNNHQQPPEGSIRVEEMINYFNYQYPQPKGEKPFALISEVAQSPWNPEHQLVHIGIQGKDLDYDNIKASNFVFLVDASGSMNSSNKLPLLKRSLQKLLTQLGPQDRVAIVAYAGAAGLVLPSTSAQQSEVILSAIDRIRSGGSTAGGAGIELAYKIAKENYIPEGNNRVILATDGDFNVGTSSSAGLVNLIKRQRDQNIFLTLCGFGMGNYKDDRMEELSNAGNGNFFYIDSDREATKVFVREMRANMFTIAKDVKIQVEFNSEAVSSYRLIGYVNRKLHHEDFDNDKIDAGELGPGHTVTALYEIIPKNSRLNDNLMTLKLRYKAPKGKESKLIQTQIKGSSRAWAQTSPDYRFSASVAAFGMKLNQSSHISMAWNQIESLAKGSQGVDENGDRREFIQLLNIAKNLNSEEKYTHRTIHD